jgi:hypothetical protein
VIDWIRLKKKTPPLYVSVLVRLDLVGPVYDVATFNGIMPDGEVRWTLADVRIDHTLITHWAFIQEPHETRRDIEELWGFKCH